MSSLGKNNSLLRRTMVMLPSVFSIGLAVSLFIKANLGADAFSSFQIALSQKTGLSVGALSVVCGVVIVSAFFFIDKTLIGIGSVAFAAGVGPSISFCTHMLSLLFPAQPAFAVGIIYVTLGLLLTALAVANYLPLNLGAQATDMVAIAISRVTKKTVGFGMLVFNVALFTAAFLLGAPMGIGTIICVAFTGKLVDVVSPRWEPICKRLAGMK